MRAGRVTADPPKHSKASTAIVCCLVVLSFMTSPVIASNLAFLLRLNLPSGPTETLYWVSLPYAYQPAAAYPNLQVDAEDLVQDLQPSSLTRPCTDTAANCSVKEVWRWDASTGEYEIWTGGSASGVPFNLQPGESYGLLVQEVFGVTDHILDLVGTHDPTFEHSVCWQPGAVNMRWIGLPPHFVTDISFGNPDVLDAEDLGQALGGPERVVQIRRFDQTTGLFENWVVGSVYGSPFAISTNEGYAVDLTCPDPEGGCGQCTWTWAPAHY